MKKFFAVLVMALIAIAPVIASADAVFYLQGQQNQVVTGGSQGQIYVGGAIQGQGGSQSSLQGQTSTNHADVKGLFNIPLHAVNANGTNVQGQGSSYQQVQGGAGLALGVQHQGTVQTQGQFQLSGGSAH